MIPSFPCLFQDASKLDYEDVSHKILVIISQCDFTVSQLEYPPLLVVIHTISGRCSIVRILNAISQTVPSPPSFFLRFTTRNNFAAPLSVILGFLFFLGISGGSAPVAEIETTGTPHRSSIIVADDFGVSTRGCSVTLIGRSLTVSV